MPKIVLASVSPRRKELLNQLKLDFEIRPALAEEKKVNDPVRKVKESALTKALAVARKERDAIVIAADTVVVLNGKIFGKPKNSSEAFKMLKALSGKAHRVITGLALVDSSGRQAVEHVVTKVYFRTLSNEEIASYVDSREPLDKAGGYGIQGLGALLIERIEGCYFNVVGLPLSKLGEMLKNFGVDILCRKE